MAAPGVPRGTRAETATQLRLRARAAGYLGLVVDTRAEYAKLTSLYLPIGLGVFALVVIVFAAFVWRYRAGRDAPTGGPSEHMAIEGAWVAAIAITLVVLVVATFRVENRVDAVAAKPALTVHVVAAKWVWRFQYPDGRTSRDELVVPSGRTIRFDAVSLDVLHDFWISALRFQRQVWPDHHERFDLVFPHPGEYSGQCAWFCGLYHDDMRFTVRALGASAFARWEAAQR